MTKPKEKKQPVFKALGESEVWESDNKVSEATILERKDGTRGIAFRMGKKVDYMKNPRYGRTIWIDEDLDLPSWLSWFLKTVKKLYFNLFGKRIRTGDEKIEYLETKLDSLTEELAVTKQKLDKEMQKSEDYQKKLELAKKVKGKAEDFKKDFDSFKSMIEESIKEGKGKEDDIKEKIKQCSWLLGLECSVEAKNLNIDAQAQVDMHVKTKYNQDRVFEFKSPHVKPFVRRTKTQRLGMSSELADGLSELIVYLRKTDVYSNINEEGTYGVQKATGYIVIGYNLLEEEQRLLREINFHLRPHIQILTYNDLEKNIEQELEIVRKLDKQSEEISSDKHEKRS
ncbi:MAG: Shedu anti-phage system protein SduA domain-containing protein [Candidatus Diapherotrites archaeon]